MKNNHLMTIAVAGLSLCAVSQAMAQNSYNAYHLLLNFRNFTTPSDSDITVDLGNVTNFVNAVNALPGGTAVINSGAGFATSSYPTQFAWSDVTDLLGGAPATNNEIGFSACASDHSTGLNGNGLIWLTRKQSTGTATPPSPASQQQNLNDQSLTSTAIFNIGLETEASDAQSLAGSGENAVSYPSGDPDSYQSQGEQSVNANAIINYGTSQNTAAGAGGLMEQLQKGTGSIFEALWQVPVSGSGSDIYLGVFTLKNTGELDFTVPSSQVTVPPLSIAKSGANVVVSWPATGTFTLVESSSLTGTWSPNSQPTNSAGGIDSVTINPSLTTQFFKLRYP